MNLYVWVRVSPEHKYGCIKTRNVARTPHKQAGLEEAVVVRFDAPGLVVVVVYTLAVLAAVGGGVAGEGGGGALNLAGHRLGHRAKAIETVLREVSVPKHNSGLKLSRTVGALDNVNLMQQRKPLNE